MTRFSKHQVWDRVLPSYLALRSSSKGDAVDARKHLAGVMQHRDPMRGSIPMLGLYFAYQFFDLQDELPSMENWLQSMHRRPLIRLQSGRAAHVTDFNTKLSQDLELIGAKHSGFTLHGIRNQRIGEAKEDPKARGESIMNGAGHSTGSHFDNYKGCLETPWMLTGAGYRGTEPEMQAAHDRALLDLLYEHPDQAQELVDKLYRHHRPELLTLEADAANEKTEAGTRMNEFLHYVRICILSWIVSTTARPRRRLGLIAAGRPVKLFLVAPVFTEHLKPILASKEYAFAKGLTLRHEEYELSIGEMAQRSEEERRISLQIGSLPDKIVASISDARTDVAQLAADRVDLIMANRASLDDVRKKAEAQIRTYKRLRAIFGPIYDMFQGGQPSEQDILRRQEFSSDVDPIHSFVRSIAAEEDDLSESGPTGLQRYRALRIEIERSNAVSDVRTCELCISEGVPHTEVVCIHALMGQKPPQRSFFDPISSGWRIPSPTAGLAPRALATLCASDAPAPGSSVSVKPHVQTPSPLSPQLLLGAPSRLPLLIDLYEFSQFLHSFLYFAHGSKQRQVNGMRLVHTEPSHFLLRLVN